MFQCLFDIANVRLLYPAAANHRKEDCIAHTVTTVVLLCIIIIPDKTTCDVNIFIVIHHTIPPENHTFSRMFRGVS